MVDCLLTILVNQICRLFSTHQTPDSIIAHPPVFDHWTRYGVLRAQRPFLRILRGVKSHGDTFLKGTAPKTNPKIPNSRRANPSTLHKAPM